MARYSHKPQKQLRQAQAEINRLFTLAASALNQALANRYVKLARELAMRFKIRLTSAQKRSFCKKCGSFLRPGVNCRVRVRKGKTTYTCLICKGMQRIPYRPKRRSSKV